MQIVSKLHYVTLTQLIHKYTKSISTAAEHIIYTKGHLLAFSISFVHLQKAPQIENQQCMKLPVIEATFK